MLTMKVEVRSNIGRMACIQLLTGEAVYGNVLDLVHRTNKPKRIRIQHGLPEKHGEVVTPAEYHFNWWADEEDP